VFRQFKTTEADRNAMGAITHKVDLPENIKITLRKQ
jgi:hypothetical protein